ncbi:hypothetical protein [Halospeciosus flavus]|uniref:hypothetical protein n=1 Tax=Halospeciosus flavus TaxID=3032283 RepID=UPI00361C1E86
MAVLTDDFSVCGDGCATVWIPANEGVLVVTENEYGVTVGTVGDPVDFLTVATARTFVVGAPDCPNCLGPTATGMILEVLETAFSGCHIKWGEPLAVRTEPRFECFFSAVVAVRKFGDEVMVTLRAGRLWHIVDCCTVDASVVAVKWPTEEMGATLEHA